MNLSEIVDAVYTDPIKRRFICQQSYFWFFWYYMEKYRTHDAAPFHIQMGKELEFNGYQFLMWKQFRESAKSAYGRGKALADICFGRKRNIHWIGHSESKARKNVRSIANELQGNRRIIEDFGQLYFEQSSKKNKESKPKTVTEFVTENGCYVKAGSTQINMRGEGYDEFRPDLIILDDIENDETIRSLPKTQSVKNFCDEVFGGLAPDCNVLILGNYLSRSGSIAYLERKAKGNDNWRVHTRALVEKGEVTWPGKYTKTIHEAYQRNQGVENEKKHVRSVEQLKQDLGTARYNQEFLNLPIAKDFSPVREEWFEKGRGRYSKENLSKNMNNVFTMHFNGVDRLMENYEAIDPAVSMKESADDRAIVTVGKINHNNTDHFFVLAADNGKWTINGFTEKIKAQRDKLHPKSIGVESEGVQEVFRDVFAREGIATISLRANKKNKMERLMRHTPDMEFGRVHFPQDGSCDNLLEELFNFDGTGASPDNLVDAFAYAMQMAKQDGGAGIYIGGSKKALDYY